MITDALLAADPVLKLSESVDDMSRYIHMTDSVLRIIMANPDARLDASKAIINRLHRRDLYRFVDQVTIPFELQPFLKKDMITPLEIVSRHKSDIELFENDIIVGNAFFVYIFFKMI